jgi:hypothetical protein
MPNHTQLRDLADRCEQLADEVDAGHGTPELLIREVAHLRTVFDEYRREPHALAGTYRAEDTSEDSLVVRHPTFAELGPTGELRQVLAALRGYLTGERCCLARRRW